MPEFIFCQKVLQSKNGWSGEFPQRKILFYRSSSFPTLHVCLFDFGYPIAFWQVRNNEFINLDDDLYVTDNSHIQQGIALKGILWALTAIHFGHRHPMTWLSHMLDYNLYGLNPSGHHITNLLFHVANSLLIFLLFQRMTGHSGEAAL